MAAKIGIWFIWVFAVFIAMVTSPLAAALGLPILVVFSPALFLILRRWPLAAQLIAALILGAYAARMIMDQIL